MNIIFQITIWFIQLIGIIQKSFQITKMSPFRWSFIATLCLVSMCCATPFDYVSIKIMKRTKSFTITHDNQLIKMSTIRQKKRNKQKSRSLSKFKINLRIFTKWGNPELIKFCNQTFKFVEKGR